MPGASADRSTADGSEAPAPYWRALEGTEPLRQGELLHDIVEWVPNYDSQKVVGTHAESLKLAIVVTQECDLEQDFNARSGDHMREGNLKSVLLCQARPADEGRDLQSITNRFWTTVRQNKAERYHYLAAVPPALVGAGLEHTPILVDFKSFFALRSTELYRQLRSEDAGRLAVLNSPWKEHLQMRFANYIGRIGLPVDHFVPEDRRDA